VLARQEIQQYEGFFFHLEDDSVDSCLHHGVTHSNRDGNEEPSQRGVERRTDTAREGPSITDTVRLDGSEDVNHSPHCAEQSEKGGYNSNGLKHREASAEVHALVATDLGQEFFYVLSSLPCLPKTGQIDPCEGRVIDTTCGESFGHFPPQQKVSNLNDEGTRNGLSVPKSEHPSHKDRQG
jgi:hypothetical protein